jgi:hypothetical protein
VGRATPQLTRRVPAEATARSEHDVDLALAVANEDSSQHDGATRIARQANASRDSTVAPPSVTHRFRQISPPS